MKALSIFPHSRPGMEQWFLTGVLVTCLGSYLGNAFISAGHVFLLVAIGFVVTHRVRTGSWSEVEGHRFRIRGSSWLLLALVAAMAISVLVNLGEIERPLRVLKKLRYHLIWLAPIFLISLRAIPFQQEWMKRWTPWLLLAWLVSIFAASLSGLIGLWTDFNPLRFGPDPRPHRASGIFGMVMTYAYSIQLSILLLLGLLLERKRTLEGWMGTRRWPLIACLLALLAAGLGLYFSFTRGALLGLLLGFGILIFATGKRWLMLSVVGLGLVAAAFAWTQKHRYFAFSELELESVRVGQWKTAMLIAREKPFFGVGYRQFEERSVELKERFGIPPDLYRTVDGVREGYHIKLHAHNDYLEALASTGFIGGAIYLAFCLTWFWEVSRQRLTRVLFLPAIGAFLFSSLFQNVFTDSEVLGFLLLIYFASQVSLDAEESGDSGVVPS